MKFKFRADGEDLLIFVIFAFFLLYVVAIMVVNVHTFATEGGFVIVKKVLELLLIKKIKVILDGQKIKKLRKS